MPPHDVAALLHLVAFLTGAALYGLLLTLVTQRDSGARRAAAGGDSLPALTAILGLIWNVSGLAVFAWRDFTGRELSPLLIATAYSALGFLPAVVVHSVLRSEAPRNRRRLAISLIAAAYAASTVAEALMFWTALREGEVPSRAALHVLSWSYVALLVAVILLTRRSARGPRSWSIVALAAFAVSALHLSRREGGSEGWLTELVGHHASIPLIFAILYQDFRFALADLFLKRALALFALVTAAGALYVGVEIPLLSRHDFANDPVAIGGSLILWVLLALAYPFFGRAARWIVDRLLLDRRDPTEVLQELDHQLEQSRSFEDVIDVLTALVKTTFDAETHVGGGEVVGCHLVSIPTTEPPHASIAIGPLVAGRRLLSDDLRLLDELARHAARRIDAIRLEQLRLDQSVREQEMTRLTTEAELRALRAQLNPHFLFNALNTIGYLIGSAPARAQATLLKLTALLRRSMRSGTMTTLGEELDLVSAFLEIEQARFEERLATVIDVPSDLRGLQIPALLVQPLVENAIKHGIATSRAGGFVAVEGTIEDGCLTLVVRNRGRVPSAQELASARRRGVGLSNLEARLHHLYGDSAHFSISALASETRAEIRIPLDTNVEVAGRA